MLRKLKIASLATVCALALSPVAFAQSETKIPAFDHNAFTVMDGKGNCVLTKWDGAGTECGGSAETAKVLTETTEADEVWRTIYFAFDSATLSGESKEKLNRLHEKLTRESDSILSANIVGYADEIGTNDYNYKLSQRRANAVHDYLRGLGYEGSNVTDIRALGSRSSAGKCPTSMKRRDRIACLWEDRRVEIELEYLNKFSAEQQSQQQHMHKRLSR